MRPQDTTPTGVVRIPLRARDGAVRDYAIVDAADAEWVNQWRWHLSTSGHAARTASVNGKKVMRFLHRELLALAKGDGREGDHINRDRLDNRRCNLRVITHAGNAQNLSPKGNTSKYRGVHWYARTRKWRACVSAGGKTRVLGQFDTEEEAAKVALAARRELLPFAVD